MFVNFPFFPCVFSSGIQYHYRKLLQSCASWARDINERAGVTQVFSIKSKAGDPAIGFSNISSTCRKETVQPLLPPRSGFDYGYCGLLDYGADIPFEGNPWVHLMLIVDSFVIFVDYLIFYVQKNQKKMSLYTGGFLIFSV